MGARSRFWRSVAFTNSRAGISVSHGQKRQRISIESCECRSGNLFSCIKLESNDLLLSPDSCGPAPQWSCSEPVLAERQACLPGDEAAWLASVASYRRHRQPSSRWQDVRREIKPSVVLGRLRDAQAFLAVISLFSRSCSSCNWRTSRGSASSCRSSSSRSGAAQKCCGVSSMRQSHERVTHSANCTMLAGIRPARRLLPGHSLLHCRDQGPRLASRPRDRPDARIDRPKKSVSPRTHLEAMPSKFHDLDNPTP